MSATIFNGALVKALKNTLKLGSGSRIISGSANPSSSATTGEIGSLYLSSNGTGAVYYKTDSGSSTNWNALGTTATTQYESADLAANLAISCSVGSSALTVALKTAAGTDPSGSDVVKIGFRSSTLTSGVYTVRSVTSALSLVVSSGSTLGTTSGTAGFIYVYAIDNSGTVELAISSQLYSDGTLVSTTAEGGAGAADSKSVIYSTTARSNVPIRLIARLISTQTTAGTWAAVPTEVALSFGRCMAGVYTPTITNGTNISSNTSHPCRFQLIDNVVTVFGFIQLTASGAGGSTAGISLPIPSTLATDTLGGHGGNSNDNIMGRFEEDTGNNRATYTFTAVTANNRPHYFTFSYTIQ